MGVINIKKLAEELNISAASVSRALRDSHEISTETKERVWALAKKLNYQPNPFASSLRQNKSKTIAVILPDVDDNFFAQAINGIEEVAREKGFHVLIYLTHESAQQEASFIKTLTNGRVDGLLISLSSENEDFSHLEEIRNNGIPIVFFDRIYEGSIFNVTTNDYESSFNATEHLIENGCKNIAYLLALNSLTAGKQRLLGYTDALKKHNFPINNSIIIDCSKNDEENERNIKQLITSKNADGIVSSIEKLAILCYFVCNDLKASIPGDVKIVSFSNHNTAPLLNPSLSTITQPAFDIGKEAATMLFQILKNSNFIPESKVLPSKLIQRNSSLQII